MISKKNISLSLLALCPVLLFAHGSHGSGVMSGFTHPILGVDHLVAILGTGMLGYLMKPKQWFLPLLSFLVLMIIGGFLGIGNEATFMIEKVIAFSVFALGVLIAFEYQLGLMPILILTAAFGFFHGYAHGAEMDAENTALKYISGYSLGTLLAGTIGMVLGRVTKGQESADKLVRILGGVIIGCGVMMLLP